MFGLSRQISSRISKASSRSFTTSNFPGQQLHVRQNSVLNVRPTWNVRSAAHVAVVGNKLNACMLPSVNHVINCYSGGPYPYVACRAYSSASGKDLDKVAETHTSKSVKDIKDSSDALLSRSKQPTNMERRIFVWTGKYKTVDDVPNQVSEAALSASKNKFRIYINLGMGAVTVIASIIMIIIGKSRAKKGESLSQVNIKRHPEVYNKLADDTDHACK